MLTQYCGFAADQVVFLVIFVNGSPNVYYWDQTSRNSRVIVTSYMNVCLYRMYIRICLYVNEQKYTFPATPPRFASFLRGVGIRITIEPRRIVVDPESAFTARRRWRPRVILGHNSVQAEQRDHP